MHGKLNPYSEIVDRSMILPLKSISSDHESLFIERYDRLLKWGLQLTERDNDLAQDILHDAFIQFTLTPPDLETIQNLDAYLYGLLRNLHLSQMRRATRSRFQQLSIIDYESAVIGLHAADPRTHIQVQEELRRVCHYACARKETSRAGSVLILRFFHGYYPSEISKILQCTRLAVDLQIKRARTEARAYLERPETLRFITDRIPEVPSSDLARSPLRFSNELRELIFATRAGRCFGRDELTMLYKSEQPLLFESKQLAHIVSCPTCLDIVNQLLDLPLLKERYAMDTLGNDPRSQGGPPTGTSSSGNAITKPLTRWKRDARDAFEHKPQELCISVNGYLQGSQRISSDVNEQSLTIDMDERIGFIEVFSEQGIRLLLLNVEEAPPEGPGERSLHAQLSDTRTLDMSLRFSSPWPTIHVVYRDPALRQLSELNTWFDIDLDVAMRPVGVTVMECFTDEQGVRDAVSSSADMLSASAVGGKRHIYKGLRAAWEAVSGLRFSGFTLLSRPALPTLFLAALAVIGATLLIHRQSPSGSFSAADLLQRATVADQAIASNTTQVVHRTITLEERKFSSGPMQGSVPAAVGIGSPSELVTSRRIEIWHSAERGVTARRLYDDRGALVAGDWTRKDGVQTLYHHGARPQLKLSNEQAAFAFDSAWLFDLSARQFSALIQDSQNISVEDRGVLYIISAESMKSDGLIRASILLNRSDLHAIGLTVVLKQGEETREYNFRESSFEVRSPSVTPPSAFEPEPELLSDSGTRRHGGAVTIPATPRANFSAPLPVASADLEVEVLNLLHQVGADMDGQIAVSRESDGVLHLSGAVESAQRKAEILHVLAPVTANAAVQIEIRTVAEALAQENKNRARSKQATASIEVERIETDTDVFPAYEELRRRFSDDDARRYATRMVARAHEVMRHAWALKSLQEKFRAADINRLSPAARTLLLDLIRSHARVIEIETAGLRQELQPIFFPVPPAVVGAEISINNDEDLIFALTRLFEACSNNYDIVRGALTVSNKSSGISALNSSQFWRSLKSLESVASAITKVQ